MAIIVTSRRHMPAPIRAAYVGRPSALGNPFVLWRDGNRDEVIAKYAVWLDEQLAADTPARRYFDVIAERVQEAEAQGHTFGLECYCAPLPCHADIIKARLEQEGGAR